VVAQRFDIRRVVLLHRFEQAIKTFSASRNRYRCRGNDGYDRRDCGVGGAAKGPGWAVHVAHGRRDLLQKDHRAFGTKYGITAGNAQDFGGRPG
jgi:hypothetical protein